MVREGLRYCCATALLAGLFGCQAERHTPEIGFGNLDLRADITRSDIVVEDKVEGTSTDTQVLLGLFDIVDGNKVVVLGIPFFKDKWVGIPGKNFSDIAASAENRAYYNALEKAPDADAVLIKSEVQEQSGIPIFFHTVNVTFSGKALRLKADGK